MISSDQLRQLAARLRDRHSAPSLDGYCLVDGLRAAADLLEGLPGPLVHEDCLTRDAFGTKVPLRVLLPMQPSSVAPEEKKT